MPYKQEQPMNPIGEKHLLNKEYSYEPIEEIYMVG